MDATYLLSGRQRKELANGKILRIALPHPRGEVSDQAAWFRAHLDLEPSDLISDVADVWLTINPLAKDGGGVGMLLGKICREQDAGQALWTLEVGCIVADIAASRVVRGQYPTQWPGRVCLPTGKMLPAE